MESKHTPGPWTLIHEPDLTAITAFRIDGSSEIAALPNLSASDEANAKLMAAAPEMLEALIQARAAMPDRAFATDEAKPVIDLINAAIAKAKGE